MEFVQSKIFNDYWTGCLWHTLATYKLEHEKNIKTLENKVKSQADMMKNLREESKKKK